MNERIRKLRKALDLTQREFAERIGVKQNTIATYEIGRSEPIDAVISLICREFGVSETWLRTGNGEMFIQKTRNDEISDFIGDVLSGDPDFRSRFISLLARMTTDEWKMLERKALELAATAQSAALEQTPTIEEEARAEAEEYYRQILAEKEQAARLSASQDCGGGKLA